MKRIEPTGNNRSRSPTARQISIGGPRLWLAYAAAAGTGMSSFSFVNWCRSRLGLPVLAAAKTEPFFLTGFVFLVVIGLWFLGVWYLLVRRFDREPDLRESRRLLVLVFAACLYWAVWLVAFRTMHSATGGRTWNVLARVSMLFVAIIIPAVFAIRDPRHGFFWTGLTFLNSYGLGFALSEDAGNFDLYLAGIRMATVFLYVTAGMRVQRVIAGVMAVILSLMSCGSGLLGPVVGTIIWEIRRKRAAGRRLRQEGFPKSRAPETAKIASPEAKDESDPGTSSGGRGRTYTT